MRITRHALEQQLAELEQRIIALEAELLAHSAARGNSPISSRWRRCYRQMLAIEHRLAGRALQAAQRDEAPRGPAPGNTSSRDVSDAA